jgi:apolipoprotein D and lipocalin family protein
MMKRDVASWPAAPLTLVFLAAGVLLLAAAAASAKDGQKAGVARFPNRFHQKCAGDVKATYSRRPDGRLNVVNECRTKDGGTTVARGVARVADERTRAKLKVRFAPAALSFLPFVWGDYWIIGLADDYHWALVGSPGRDYLWILSRTPQLDEADLEGAKAIAEANGFDTSRLTMTQQ